MKRLFLLIIISFIGTLVRAQELDSLLKAVYNSDQEVRREMNRLSLQQPPAQDSIIAVYTRMREVDAKNQQVVFSLLDQHGWPQGIGIESHIAIWTVIQHAELSSIKKYMPLVTEQAEAGNLPGMLYATMLDRVLMFEKLPQRYGTQTVTLTAEDEERGTTYIWPVENPAALDSLRAGVKLPPIADYVTLMEQAVGSRVIWDPETKVEDLPIHHRK